MAASNNSTDCYNFINSTSQLVTDLSTTGTMCLFGAGSCLTAIVLILVAKAHKAFIYRLLLYMAVDGLLECPVALAYIFVSDYTVQYEILTATILLESFFIYVYSILLCWLGLYLFSLAVFRVQLNKTKHEAIGLVTVLVTPLIFSLFLLWKKIFCFNNNLFKLSLLYLAPGFLLLLLSCFFVGALLICDHF